MPVPAPASASRNLTQRSADCEWTNSARRATLETPTRGRDAPWTGPEPVLAAGVLSCGSVLDSLLMALRLSLSVAPGLGGSNPHGSIFRLW